MKIVHTPVLVDQVLDNLVPPTNGLLVDCTLGEGGHTNAFLEKYPTLKVIGLERDQAILEKAKKRLEKYKDRVTFVNTWFNDFFENTDVTPDIILFDLGISIFHYVESERGFSFTKEEKLDMRLDKNQIDSAYSIVNFTSERDLADLIYNYGEERYSRRISRAICYKREEKKIETSKELADIIFHSVPRGYRYSSNHPATKTFQAIRIAVNKELDRIRPSVSLAINRLSEGGRVGVISFHSLEDRIVKNLFKDFAGKGSLNASPCIDIITKKPLIANKEECELNPPSRVAKLRVAQKKEVHSERL